jgi:hypothetical protein
LQAPQAVELAASASAQSVKAGVPVVLHAQRQTQGSWKRIPSRDLAPDQCWMAAVPPTKEPEVADNVLWREEPASAAKFSIDFRPDRTRSVTLSEAGLYTFTPSTSVWCELGRSVRAEPFQITVTPP